MVSPYLRRRSGLEPTRYLHENLRPALRETFGVIVYHEQVMRTLSALAGWDLTYADHVRRHLDDEALLPGFRERFLRGATRRGLDRGVAEKTWDAVVEFASFGFCKAHAAAFAVPTYRSAWLKAHYPAHFLSGILTHDPGMYPRRALLDDARRHGIPILPLDVNVSEPEYVAEETPAGTYGIRLALQDVHGISDAEVRSILIGRAERPFTSVEDFLHRTSVARPVVEALAHAGGFDALPQPTNRRGHLFAAITTEAQRQGDQLRLPLAKATDDRPFAFRDYTDAEVVRAELEVLGLDATRHVASFFGPLFRDLGVIHAEDVWRCRADEWVMVAGVKVSSQTPAIRSGQRIIFVTLDDGTGPLEVTVFESVQPKVAKTVFHAFAMVVWGQVRRTGRKGVSVVAEDVWDLTALHRARGEDRLREAMAGPVQPTSPDRRLWHASPGSAG
jgi:error-prone DNA polymerase